jgi:hypothetical protein
MLGHHTRRLELTALFTMDFLHNTQARSASSSAGMAQQMLNICQATLHLGVLATASLTSIHNVHVYNANGYRNLRKGLGSLRHDVAGDHIMTFPLQNKRC